ncbi:hypothetical protein T01_6739, partial [Trichinella spiralis]
MNFEAASESTSENIFKQATDKFDQRKKAFHYLTNSSSYCLTVQKKLKTSCENS